MNGGGGVGLYKGVVFSQLSVTKMAPTPGFTYHMNAIKRVKKIGLLLPEPVSTPHSDERLHMYEARGGEVKVRYVPVTYDQDWVSEQRLRSIKDCDLKNT